MKRFWRLIWLVVLVEFVVFYSFGRQLERAFTPPGSYLGLRAVPASPLHVRPAGASILDPGQHEQQIRESVQVA